MTKKAKVDRIVGYMDPDKKSRLKVCLARKGLTFTAYLATLPDKLEKELKANGGGKQS